MTQPNPFSTANSLEHLVNPKVITNSGNYEVAVDIANVDTYYGRQLGGPTASQEIQQAYIRQIGSTGISGSAFFNQIGSTASSGSAFFNQIGTTGSSGSAFFNQIGSLTSRGNGYFDTVYWNAFSPALPSGGGPGATLINGPGINTTSGLSGTTISSLIQVGSGLTLNNPGNGQPYIIGNTITQTFVQGSTGIRSQLIGNTYTLSSTLSVTGSQYIGVQQNGATFTVSYLGSPGGSGAPVGISGAYGVFGASGLESSTVLTSSNIVGPTGALMLYSPQGPTYRNYLYSVDGTFPIVVAPFVSSRFSNGTLDLVPFTTQNFIQTSGTNAQAFPLNISGGSGNFNLTKFDIPQGKVIINPNYNFPTGVANLLKGSANTTQYFRGGTYNVYLYGGGGAGLSGYAGGAGGYVKIQNIGATGSGVTFNFLQLSSNNGGGTALKLNINNTDVAIAPGGGAGGTRTPGAAYGEPGGSYNGQGFSAGGTGGTGGIFTDFQTNGTIGYNYRVGSTGATAQSGIFNNVQVTYGLTGNFANNTIIYAFNANPTSIGNITSGATSTYYFPPGTTLIFQTNGITFNNSTYSLNGITYGIFDLAVPLTSLTGATFSRQAVGGTFTIDPALVDQSFQDGYIGGTFIGDGSGIDQMLSGATFTTGVTGVTLTIINSNTLDNPITGGIEIRFNSDLTGSFSRSLGSVLTPTVRITDPIFIQPNSIIQVQYQNTISRGQTGGYWTAINGGFFGGGNGEFGGGGGTGGGGGGAGQAYINPIVSGITGAGLGTTPFIGQYNIDATAGFGGSGTQGGLPYYVVEQVNPGSKPDVLEVNGNEFVNGNEIINGSITVNQPLTGGTRVAWFTNNSSDFNNGRSIAIFHDQNPGPMIAFSENVAGLSGQGGQLSFIRDTTINTSLAGNFNMDRPLSVQGNIYGYQTPIKVLLDSPVTTPTNYIVPPTLSGRTGYLVHVKMMGGGGSASTALNGGGGGSGFIFDSDGIKVPGGTTITYFIGEGGGGVGGPGQGGASTITIPGYPAQMIALGGLPGTGANGGAGGYGGGGGGGLTPGLGGSGQLGPGLAGNSGLAGQGGGPSIIGVGGSGNIIYGGAGIGAAGPSNDGGGGGGLGGGNGVNDTTPLNNSQNATSYGGGGGAPFSNSSGIFGKGFQGVIFLTLTPY